DGGPPAAPADPALWARDALMAEASRNLEASVQEEVAPVQPAMPMLWTLEPYSGDGAARDLDGAKGEGVAPVETPHPALWMLTADTGATRELAVAAPSAMPAAPRPRRGLLPAGAGLALLAATRAAAMR